jgi:hypothetical protein
MEEDVVLDSLPGLPTPKSIWVESESNQPKKANNDQSR